MDYIYAFITGGAICVVGQLLMDATRLTAPRVLVLLVCAGAVLQAFGLYEYLVQFAGTGARVPFPVPIWSKVLLKARKKDFLRL